MKPKQINHEGRSKSVFRFSAYDHVLWIAGIGESGANIRGAVENKKEVHRVRGLKLTLRMSGVGRYNVLL